LVKCGNYKVLLLAQTPPPFHGQSIMQKYLVDDEWNWCKKEIIRLDFSENISIVGKFNISKLPKLINVILSLIKQRLINRIDIIYYPPSSPNKIPFYRDILLVPFIRIASKKVIFHFHSGGFNKLLDKLNSFEKKLAGLIYSNVDLAIVLLPSLKNEVEWIKPKKILSVPNGIEDCFEEPFNRIFNIDQNIKLLFVGNLKKEKGILDLLLAIKMLKGVNLEVIGSWHNDYFKNECIKFIKDKCLEERVIFHGAKVDAEKWEIFKKADIFCLPTYETEAMPVTLIEAMMYKLPIITTNWRAIPDIVTDGVEGFLVPIKSANEIAAKIELLAKNKNLRDQMGEKGREKFLKEYTIENHLSKMEKAFKDLLN